MAQSTAQADACWEEFRRSGSEREYPVDLFENITVCPRLALNRNFGGSERVNYLF